MLVELRIQRRPASDNDMPVFHFALMEKLTRIEGFLRPDGVSALPAWTWDDSFGAQVPLKRAADPSIDEAVLRYGSRLERVLSKDKARDDDSLSIGIDPTKVDYRAWLREKLPAIISAFRPYRAQVFTDIDLATRDWNKVREAYIEEHRSIEGRDGVIRIWPANFFDEILCGRAFGMTSEEVVARAASECEAARQLEGGAFLLVTSELITNESALDELHARIMRRLDKA